MSAKELAELGDARVALPAGFAIADEVRAAVGSWNMDLVTRTDWVCAGCRQVVVPVRCGQGADWPADYRYTPEEAQGLVLAHLMQRHGWTRETIGER